MYSRTRTDSYCRLRQTDVKADHYERKVQALEQEVASWEKKHEEMTKKYMETKEELEKFAAELGNI
jgi:tropomyosin